MLSKNIFLPILLFILLVQCKREEVVTKTIEIKTDKTEYQIFEQISLIITNHLEKEASHFSCDQIDIAPSHLVEKDNSENWIENELTYNCTHVGPMGYFGTLLSSAIKNDSTSIEETGTYKLKYTFIIENDTTFYYSNEFSVIAPDCNTDDPLNDIIWLNQLKTAFEMSMSPMRNTIVQFDYDGERVFSITPCAGCADAMTTVYDCLKNEICLFGGIAGFITCPDFADKATNETVLFDQ